MLFESEEDAEAALKLDGEYIGSRFLKLNVMTYGQYSRFNGPEP